MMVANILRILFWFGRPFELPYATLLYFGETSCSRTLPFVVCPWGLKRQSLILYIWCGVGNPFICRLLAQSIIMVVMMLYMMHACTETYQFDGRRAIRLSKGP